MSATLADWGEHRLLRRLQRFSPPAVVGDDGAVLKPEEGRSLVVTTDVLVAGVHFSEATTPPDAVGWRAMAANLSDLAAMGATPWAVTVGLSLPPDTEIAWVEALYGGMQRCLDRYGGAIVGGDLTRSPTPTLAITAFGQVDPGQILRRQGAQVGAAIVVTGYHGSARAGLALLLGEMAARAGGDRWIAAHQYPQPRLDVLAPLQRLTLGANIAAMDSSDGLADAVVQLCRASGVGAVLAADQIPLDPDLITAVGQELAQGWALYGGEDFQLVLCLPPQIAAALVAELGPPAAIIGTITAGLEVVIGEGDRLQSLDQAQGFQHFPAP
ncbi:thiamine-phosphate kinase [Spirulina sp. CCNP1310]|uniref:thiamine-phosphate kinase n=1 Tax=Spirulina sp. CCNP1310 TaxID=3110249 RepID=UPI002B1F80EE|nr:thiamine-phosphate kinase [Spirulina sp. CCNP1310]MEA5417589.1 thiamine-phosphate kinase [Spirulina sp. CCNP1310]